MSKARRQRFGGGMFLILSLGNLTCTEIIPPFLDPKDFFVVSTSIRYSLELLENTLHVSFMVQNKYEETLQDTTVLEGSLEIRMVGNPAVKATVPITSANLKTRGKYEPATKTLTFDPGDTLRFDMKWDFIDDAGSFIPGSLFHYYVDPSCPLRCIASEEVFEISGSITLFESIQVVRVHPTRISICYVNTWIGGKICPPADISSPCTEGRFGPFPEPCVTP